MGYESRIYIVNKSKVLPEEPMVWGEIIAVFNMCKYPPIADFMAQQPATDCYVYADDGNTRITEDRYGKPLTETSVASLVKLLEEQLNHGDSYRRIGPLLGMLQEFRIVEYKFENLVVLHYGY